MGDHLYQHLECRLEHKRTAIWDVPEDEQSKYLSDVVPPSWEVGDDVLEGVEGRAHQLSVQVYGKVRQHLQEVVTCHVCRHDAGNGRHTGLQKI